MKGKIFTILWEYCQALICKEIDYEYFVIRNIYFLLIVEVQHP